MKFEVNVLSVLGFSFLVMVVTQLIGEANYFTYDGMFYSKLVLIGTLIGAVLHEIIKQYYNS